MGATVIALTGKGGVGKTSISAATVRILAERHPEAKILAIDADPAVGLSTALGVTVKETLDDIRLRVANDVTGNLQNTEDILAEARFRLFEAMEEQNGFAFLAIGRPEAEGCYCAINTYLRNVIGVLVDDFDYVVIDGEAGIEQINRRVLDKVTNLLLISDQSKKGLQILGTIKDVSDKMMMCDRAGVIVNRAVAPEKIDFTDIHGAPVLNVIGTDSVLAEMDMDGKSIFEIPTDTPLLQGVAKALETMEIL
ncbi:MAG: AAA family ATPase [Clostridia bacterium]|nr:AAA family ATPase [Clostridia bacterium]